MANWERKIGAMTLFVPDLDRAREFYQDAFGLDAQPMGDDTVMLRFKDMAVFLRQAARPRNHCPKSWTRRTTARDSSPSSSTTWTRCAPRWPSAA